MRITPAILSAMLLMVTPMTGIAPTTTTDVAERIIGAALASGGATAFLQRLTDSIGGRVTGSTQSRETAELLRETLRDAGLEQARFEEYALASTWQRGSAAGRIVAPVQRPLFVGSFGWAPGTPGEIDAPLVDLGTPSANDIPAMGDRIRGKVALATFPGAGGEPGYVMRAAVARALAQAGVAALLIPAGKPGRMLDIGCFGNYPRGALPMLSIADEDALLLRRLLSAGAVRLALDVRNILGGPSQERNVIADLRGRSQPDEMVIVGGHLDSWDTGHGALDDGSGVAAIVEAARILQSIVPRPRRTIRFAFFSGEEQAILGSAAYVTAHREELDKIRGVLIMDEGAQSPKGFRLHGRTDIEQEVRRLLAPLAPLAATGVSQEASFDMDHAFFLSSGVPVLTLWVEPGDYEVHHHAVSDTFDKIDPRMLALDTAVMALAAYLVADAEAPVGRRFSSDEATALLRRTHLESSLRLLTGGSQ